RRGPVADRPQSRGTVQTSRGRQLKSMGCVSWLYRSGGRGGLAGQSTGGHSRQASRVYFDTHIWPAEAGFPRESGSAASLCWILDCEPALGGGQGVLNCLGATISSPTPSGCPCWN